MPKEKFKKSKAKIKAVKAKKSEAANEKHK